MNHEAETRFHATWSALQLRAGEAAACANLLQRLAEPHRHYHRLAHVLDMLDELSFMQPPPGRVPEVQLAAWYHDAVYDPAAADNEAASARLAATDLARAGLAADAIQRVEAMIMDTRHTGPASSPDGAALADADLAILGADPPRFDAYDAAIREEYRFVPEPEYRRRRREVLAGFLARAAIYQTAWFRTRLEARARENLGRAIAGLGDTSR